MANMIKDSSSSMQTTVVSVAALKEEVCAHCVAKVTPALRNMKHWHAICVSSCILLSLGVTGLSSYLLYKLYKLSRKLIDLEEQLRALNIQLDLIDDFVDEKSLLERGGEKNNPKNEIPDNGESNDTKPISILSRKKSVSFGSMASLDGDYETPSTSPIDNNMFTMIPSSSSSSQRVAREDNSRIEQLNFDESHASLTQIYNEKFRLQESTGTDTVLEKIDLARVAYFCGEKESKDSSLKRKFHMEAFDLIRECLNLVATTTMKSNDDDCLDYLVHKWFAMTAGRATDHVGFNEKLKLGFEFKDHLDLAIELNGDDYLVFYLRGRWYHKMQSLSWIEKKGVKLLFNGEIPGVTMDDALRDFERVEQLHPNKSKGNLLYLSKCLIDQKQQPQRCRELLMTAVNLPTRTPEHKLNDAEINSLLNSL